MRKSLISNYRAGALLLVSLASASTGCKTASWMPSGKMFAWNRDPDPTLLASDSTESKYPESPATKYQPTSVAGMNASQDNSYASNTTSPYGNVAAQTVSTPRAGLAAQANGYPSGGGYQTGPYQTNTYATAGTAAPGSTQSPYGGSYGTTTTSPTTTMAPNTATGSAPNYSSPYGSTGSLASSPGSGVPAYPVANTSPGGMPTQANTAGLTSTTTPSPTLPAASSSYPALPSYGGTTSYPTAPPTGLAGGYPSVGTAGAASGSPTPGSTPGLPTAGTSGVSQASSGAPSAYRGATTLGGFSPGTTGRSTGYDFGEGPAPTSAPNSSLPPNTASGSNPLLR